MAIRSWSDKHLIDAVANSRSIRQVLLNLGLKPAGGNYFLIKKRIDELSLNTEHFLGQGWNVGLSFSPRKPKPIKEILVRNSEYQSYKLKRRLINEGIKKEACEVCGWCRKTIDGRIPLELDHINGDHKDNRLENLRILCPNCHSLQPTHRGLNKVK